MFLNWPQKILVVSYTFPPSGSIGGRRWAKFAKYLNKKGIEVEVIAADEGDLSGASPWSKDVEGLKVRRYTSRYSQVLGKYPSTFIDKIRYRLSLQRARRATAGTPYDRAVHDKTRFESCLKEALQEFQPDAVVATGAPFDILYFLATSNHLPEDVFFMADLRDPWIGGRAYGYSALPTPRLDMEKEKEAAVISRANLITMPWEENRQELAQRYKNSQHKIEVLPHAWDKEDIPTVAEQVLPQIIYGGTVYRGFQKVFDALKALSLRSGLTIRVFTPEEKRYRDMAESNVLEFHSPVSGSEFLREACRSQVQLLLIPGNARHGLTKIFEMAACRRPILAIGFAGKLSQLIEENGLGTFIDISNLERDLGTLNPENIPAMTSDGWLEEYEFEKVTEKLLNLLKKSKNES